MLGGPEAAEAAVHHDGEPGAQSLTLLHAAGKEAQGVSMRPARPHTAGLAAAQHQGRPPAGRAHRDALRPSGLVRKRHAGKSGRHAHWAAW